MKITTPLPAPCVWVMAVSMVVGCYMEVAGDANVLTLDQTPIGSVTAARERGQWMPHEDVPCGPLCWLAFGNADNPIPERPHECTYLGLHSDGTRWTAEEIAEYKDAT